jgi:hypothetical protein
MQREHTLANALRVAERATEVDRQLADKELDSPPFVGPLGENATLL